tara:strand:- start:10199 stop:10498 length:300 start_codon:yes stop_codon:yes gene_type:complete
MSSYNGLCSKGGHNHYTINKKNGRGILVYTLAPGAMETALFLKGKSQETIHKLNVMNAFKSLAKPIKIARLVLLFDLKSMWNHHLPKIGLAGYFLKNNT